MLPRVLVVNYVCTAANVHDSQGFKDLVDESDEAVFADSANFWEEAREHLLEMIGQDFIMHKGTWQPNGWKRRRHSTNFAAVYG